MAMWAPHLLPWTDVRDSMLGLEQLKTSMTAAWLKFSPGMSGWYHVAGSHPYREPRRHACKMAPGAIDGLQQDDGCYFEFCQDLWVPLKESWLKTGLDGKLLFSYWGGVLMGGNIE